MKRRICSIFAVLALLLSLFPVNIFADTGFGNFVEINTYDGQFADVPSNAWYAESVASAYRLGLVAGTGPETFNPDGNLRICEVITLACSLHSRYYGQDIPDADGGPWYQKYVEYAQANGIVSGTYADYNRSATRAECITVLANSLPKAGFAEINNIEYGAIPDVPLTALCAEAVYKFYRAGIMQGYAGGEFRPDNPIRRCEIAATLLRLADPSIRGKFTLSPAANTDLTADKIAEKCADAVFYIEIYDAHGEYLGSGSGFFIDSSGIAVTNYHVIDGAYSSYIMLTNGDVYSVSGIYDYDVARDIALLQVSGSGFETLSVGDSDAIAAGQTVFAIGSPQGLDNTISQGIISNVNRLIDGQKYIQTTAQISPGSSGGALLNGKGSVIGITSAYINLEGSQNLNLVIPISSIDTLGRTSLKTFAQVVAETHNYQSSTLALEPDFYYLSMAEYSGTNLNVYTDGDFATLRFDVSDEALLSCEWGEWSEDGYYIPLTITTYGQGNAYITLSLLDGSGSVLLSKQIDVSVVERSYNEAISLSAEKLDLTVGGTATVTVDCHGAEYAVVHWENSNPEAVGCRWNEWYGDKIDLFVEAYEAGSGAIIVDLMDYGVYLGSKAINVDIY